MQKNLSKRVNSRDSSVGNVDTVRARRQKKISVRH
jgi:hypothetical protein